MDDDEILTEVSAHVPDTAGDVAAEFERLLDAPLRRLAADGALARL